MNVDLIQVLILLFLHWGADFYCQSDWQARNKSSNNRALLSHTGVYSLIMTVGVAVSNTTVLPALYFGLVTFVLHTATDYVTSRINTRLIKDDKIHEFFVCVGLDQFLHYAQLLIAYKLFIAK